MEIEEQLKASISSTFYILELNGFSLFWATYHIGYAKLALCTPVVSKHRYRVCVYKLMDIFHWKNNLMKKNNHISETKR